MGSIRQPTPSRGLAITGHVSSCWKSCFFRWAQDRKILPPVPQHHECSECKGCKNEATNQNHHEVVAKRSATLTLEEEPAKLAAEIHAEEAGQDGAATKNEAQHCQPVDGLGVSQLIEVVDEIGHVSELVGQNPFHGANLVLSAEAAKQIIVRLFARDIIEMPVAAEIEELGTEFVHHRDAGQR